MKKAICVITLIASFFLNSCAKQENNSTQENISTQENNIDNEIKKLEETILLYTFYKNYIINNDLPLEEYFHIFYFYAGELEKSVDYFYNLLDNDVQLEDYQSEKIDIFTKFMKNEITELLEISNKLLDKIKNE